MSSKLSVGIHLLTVLALYPGVPLTSEQLAESANTNPVVIRRLLGLLREAGFVESKTGVGGGWVLKGDPAAISFLDILRTVEPQCVPFALPRSKPSEECPVGQFICSVLTEVYAEVHEKMDRQLDGSTIAAVVGKIRARMEGHPARDCRPETKPVASTRRAKPVRRREGFP